MQSLTDVSILAFVGFITILVAYVHDRRQK